LQKLNLEKLSVEYRDDFTPTSPTLERKYTVTHSYSTGGIILTIGLTYAYDKISKLRDELLAEWIPYNNGYALYVNVHVDVDEEGDYASSSLKNRIFVKELPTALQVISYGDRFLFNEDPALDKSPIHVKFNSQYPEFNRVLYWGTPYDYR
jgi:hypothetical protein